MKNLMYLLLIIFTILSCSKDDYSMNEQIYGEWKLTEARIVDFSPNPPIIDYSDDNIIYNFKFNGKLIVTGEENVGYTNGEYEYFFGEDYLGGAPSPGESKILLVKINTTKWTFDITNEIMTLSNSYIDGPTLVFGRN